MSGMKNDTQVDPARQALVETQAAMSDLSVKTAEYIETVQPALDKQAAAAVRFEKRATEVTGVLVDRGIISPAQSAVLVQKLAADNTQALELVARLARMVGPDKLGKQADVSVSNGTPLDAFEALALYGDPTKTHSESPLSVD